MPHWRGSPWNFVTNGIGAQKTRMNASIRSSKKCDDTSIHLDTIPANRWMHRQTDGLATALSPLDALHADAQ